MYVFIYFVLDLSMTSLYVALRYEFLALISVRSDKINTRCITRNNTRMLFLSAISNIKIRVKWKFTRKAYLQPDPPRMHTHFTQLLSTGDHNAILFSQNCYLYGRKAVHGRIFTLGRSSAEEMMQNSNQGRNQTHDRESRSHRFTPTCTISKYSKLQGLLNNNILLCTVLEKTDEWHIQATLSKRPA
jgi:hypothetical protein